MNEETLARRFCNLATITDDLEETVEAFSGNMVFVDGQCDCDAAHELLADHTDNGLTGGKVKACSFVLFSDKSGLALITNRDINFVPIDMEDIVHNVQLFTRYSPKLRVAALELMAQVASTAQG